MKKVYYICHYGDSGNRKSAPSANTKIDYIVEVLISLGYDVEIVSFCENVDRSHILKIYDEYDKIEDKYKIHYFKTYTSKFRIIRIIGRFLTSIEQKKYIKSHLLNNNSTILIYHSLSLFWIYRLLNKIKKKYIIEVEEIYSDVINKKKLRDKEIAFLQNGAKYIFPTILLNKEINNSNRNFVINHGTYKIEKEFEKSFFDDNKIHCVYAGTFDPRKGGVAAAVAAAEFLPNNYHIHILGFGSDNDMKNIKKQIENINKKSEATVSYDGLLTGNDYIKFIQSCDIGLSTQNPDASFNGTSFPSKILSYMSNGLRVVSIKILAIETSKICEYIYYYNNQTPKDISKAIMNVDMTDDYDSRSVIKKLDNEFRKDLLNLIENEM